MELNRIQQFDFKLKGKSELLLTLAVFLWIIPEGRLFQVSKRAERYERLNKYIKNYEAQNVV